MALHLVAAKIEIVHHALPSLSCIGNSTPAVYWIPPRGEGFLVRSSFPGGHSRRGGAAKAIAIHYGRGAGTPDKWWVLAGSPRLRHWSVSVPGGLIVILPVDSVIAKRS